MRSEETALRHMKVLGITWDTCEAEIRRAHRLAAMRHHPDRAPQGRVEESLARMKQVNAARDWLLANPWSWERPKSQPNSRPAGTEGELRRPSAGDAVVGPIPKAATGGALSRMLMVAVAVYLAVLMFAVAGWVICALLGL